MSYPRINTPRPQSERVFLSITAGPTPGCVEPVVCTEDPSVIDAALAAIERRLGRELAEVHSSCDENHKEAES